MKQETQNELERFRDYLREQEKSSHTIEKYCRDVRKFLMFVGEEWDKNTIISFKEYLQAHYKTSSANSMLASLNSYFHFIGRQEYCVRTFRVQKRIFCDERQEMTRSDYQKLVKAAQERGDERLCAILQTIASTGIRISELSYITAESLAQGEVVIDCKGKQRVILLPQSLMLYLTQYCQKQRIVRGSIFVTKNGQAVRRQNVWADMKSVCTEAGVLPSKVYPHNLRHLFAVVFYRQCRDIARLADVLVVTSDNPRTEEPMAIIREILAGIPQTEKPVYVEENRRRAIRMTLRFAQKDDMIVLAGKGHETYQVLGTEKIHFDEREEVAACLQEEDHEQ